MIGFAGIANLLQCGPIGGTVGRAIRRAVFSGTLILFYAGPFTEALQAWSSQQQQNPSLAETESWIAQTFSEGKHSGVNFMDYAVQMIDFHTVNKPDETPCYMQFEVDSNGSIRFMQLFNLADIDPTSIKAGEVKHDPANMISIDPVQSDKSSSAGKDDSYVFIKIKTTNDKASIIDDTYINEKGKSQTLRTMEHEAGFPEGIAVRPEYAPRFIKAMRHAVELCGGKPSIF